MCWVMPPASPATTLVWRIASRSVVFPWSTCPMTVTTGGRSTREAGSSSNTLFGLTNTSGMPTSASPGSTSTRNPKCSARGSIASWGTGAAAAAIKPMERSFLTNSPTGRRIARAISNTDTPDGTVMSSISSTRGSSWDWAGGSPASPGSDFSSGSTGSSSGSSGRSMERRASASPCSSPDEAVVTGNPRSRAVASTSLEASPSSLASSWILLVTI